MDPEKLKAAIEAIKAQDAGAALTLLEEMIVSAAAGSVEAEPAEMSADAAGQGEGEQALAEVADPAPDEDKQLMATLRAAVGATDNAALVRQLSTVFSEVRTLRERREDLDMTERRALVSQLVQVEAETPATAWEDADKQLPCKRLRDESLESLRDRAQKLTAAKGGARALRAPARGTSDEHVRAAVSRLTPRELSQIKARGMTPEQFIAHRDSLVRPIGKDAQ